jgi:hypothetical protein
LERESTVRREPRLAWRPLAGDPLWQATSAVWPARNPHPAAARFASLAREVLETRPGRPDRIVGAPGPWSVVYDEPDVTAGHPPPPGPHGARDRAAR